MISGEKVALMSIFSLAVLIGVGANMRNEKGVPIETGAQIEKGAPIETDPPLLQSLDETEETQPPNEQKPTPAATNGFSTLSIIGGIGIATAVAIACIAAPPLTPVALATGGLYSIHGADNYETHPMGYDLSPKNTVNNTPSEQYALGDLSYIARKMPHTTDFPNYNYGDVHRNGRPTFTHIEDPEVLPSVGNKPTPRLTLLPTVSQNGRYPDVIPTGNTTLAQIENVEVLPTANTTVAKTRKNKRQAAPAKEEAVKAQINDYYAANTTPAFKSYYDYYIANTDEPYANTPADATAADANADDSQNTDDSNKNYSPLSALVTIPLMLMYYLTGEKKEERNIPHYKVDFDAMEQENHANTIKANKDNPRILGQYLAANDDEKARKRAAEDVWGQHTVTRRASDAEISRQDAATDLKRLSALPKQVWSFFTGDTEKPDKQYTSTLAIQQAGDETAGTWGVADWRLAALQHDPEDLTMQQAQEELARSNAVMVPYQHAAKEIHPENIGPAKQYSSDILQKIKKVYETENQKLNAMYNPYSLTITPSSQRVENDRQLVPFVKHDENVDVLKEPPAAQYHPAEVEEEQPLSVDDPEKVLKQLTETNTTLKQLRNQRRQSGNPTLHINLIALLSAKAAKLQSMYDDYLTAQALREQPQPAFDALTATIPRKRKSPTEHDGLSMKHSRTTEKQK